MGFDLSESRTLEGSKALCAYLQDDLIPAWSLHSFGGKLLAEAHIQRDGAEYSSPYLAVIAPPDEEPVEVALKEELRNHAEEPPPPVYALMDPEDYFASRPVFREFSSIPNNGEV